MSELTQKSWSVLSERGCEASGVTYEEAARMVGDLTRAKIYGLCVITNDAAQRHTQASQQSSAKQAARKSNTPQQN
ncbi:MAG: hypothetical protein ABR577_03025 [Pyrinomonadaceae bacterium]